jgi:ribosomal protein L31E
MNIPLRETERQPSQKRANMSFSSISKKIAKKELFKKN